MPRKITTKEVIIARAHNLQKRFMTSSRQYYSKSTLFLKRHPLASFLLALGLLFALLLIGQVLQHGKVEQQQEQPIKSVKVYGIGESPKATFQAKIEKSGVVKIIAQTPGVVQSITVTEGETVGKGQQIISLASNYQGGNAASLQRQLAQAQYQNVLDTFGTQSDVVQKQRDVATLSSENSQKLRDIARQSVDETNSLITANQNQLDQMKQSLAALTAANPNDTTIPTLQGSINQLQGGINQLQSLQRNADYQSSGDKPLAKLETLQKDIALKQLDVQEKGLGLNKEVSRLQVSLAYVNESMMFPASPFAGTVERIYVHEGQLISPGTPLATITGNGVKTTAILTVPGSIAKIISLGEPSELIIDNKIIAVTPYYVSTQATDGQLYSVFYDIPKEYEKDFSDGEYVAISVPVGSAKTTSADPFIPIDAVYQSQDDAFVLVAEKDKATSKTVKLGKVYGNYVEVLSGLTSGDHIILDRNVISGDKIVIH